MILRVQVSDVCRELSDVVTQDFIELLNGLDKLETQLFISGPLPTVNREIIRFSTLLSLNTWLSKTCGLEGINY